jgi:TatD-related deoxyribonuclease
LIIFDNHLHLRRDGRYIEAIHDFKKAGGTHFVLCQYPMPDLVITEKSYESCYQQTLEMAYEIRSEIDVTVFVTVGPYPVDYLKLKEVFGRKQTIEIMKKGMDVAATLCQEKQCIAIGEIGRPHFPVDPQTIIDSNEILMYGMERAKDVGCPVVLHTESTTSLQCQQLIEMGKKVGLNAGNIVKHFAPPLITKQENFGLLPSVLASKNNIITALTKGSRFLMETDYIDDPKRPGAVLGPKTIPKLTRNLLESEVMSEKQYYDIHVLIPQKTYQIDLEKEN